MGKENLGTTSSGLKPDTAAALTYLLGFITGIVFYLTEKENKFVRFHAKQSMIAFGFLFALDIFLGYIPIFGWALLPFLWVLKLVLWVLLMIKAYSGEYFKLPAAGDMAMKNL